MRTSGEAGVPGILSRQQVLWLPDAGRTAAPWKASLSLPAERLKLFSDWRAAGFLSAGRTDRGVHARGQVIAFSTEFPDRAIKALNIQLPPDIWCTAYSEVLPAFHPRYDARSRTYRYYFSEHFRSPENGCGRTTLHREPQFHELCPCRGQKSVSKRPFRQRWEKTRVYVSRSNSGKFSLAPGAVHGGCPTAGGRRGTG